MSLSSQGESVLHFTEVFPEDAGTYECKATNAAGEVATSAYLQVESNLTISSKYSVPF
jgi:Immunoglobulin I-set domain